MRYLLFIVLLLAACENNKNKVEPTINGSWTLEEINVAKSQTDDYTGNWSSLSIQYKGDTLFYKWEKGINYNEISSQTKKKILYNLHLNIEDNVLVKCNLTDIETGNKVDTSFTALYTEGDFDFTPAGGEKYDLEIDFGNNNLYITRMLYTNKEEVQNDTLILSISSYQPASGFSSHKYIFVRD